jgi:transglutaminase-like putative cysteine protease
MTIKVAIRHQTTYSFDKAVSLSPHVFRLRPAVHCRTPITAYSLNIKPETHFINWQQDPFGNILARVVFPEKCRELSIDVEVIADLTVINPFDFFVEKSINFLLGFRCRSVVLNLLEWHAFRKRHSSFFYVYKRQRTQPTCQVFGRSKFQQQFCVQNCSNYKKT